MNSIFLFWNIGKMLYKNQESTENIIQKYSSYYSYYYGNSFLFTRENLHYMKRFYISFPVYNSIYNNFSWKQYKLLLNINDNKERYFYFYCSILFHSNYEDTYDLIQNDYYSRI